MGRPGNMCRVAAERICHAAGFQPHVRHQTDDFPTALALVAAGQGQALMPRLGTVNAPASIVLLPLPFQTRVRVTHRRGAETHPAIATFRSAVMAAVEDYRLRGQASLSAHSDRS
jgi:DNA-binding transcriptional LysR family regulator